MLTYVLFVVLMLERCEMCGGEAYVRLDLHWMCREHYCQLEALEPR